MVQLGRRKSPPRQGAAEQAHCSASISAASREVTWYARRLGYSPRTLSRATQEAVGRSAKQFVDGQAPEPSRHAQAACSPAALA